MFYRLQLDLIYHKDSLDRFYRELNITVNDVFIFLFLTNNIALSFQDEAINPNDPDEFGDDAELRVLDYLADNIRSLIPEYPRDKFDPMRLYEFAEWLVSNRLELTNRIEAFREVNLITYDSMHFIIEAV